MHPAPAPPHLAASTATALLSVITLGFAASFGWLTAHFGCFAILDAPAATVLPRLLAGSTPLPHPLAGLGNGGLRPAGRLAVGLAAGGAVAKTNNYLLPLWLLVWAAALWRRPR